MRESSKMNHMYNPDEDPEKRTDAFNTFRTDFQEKSVWERDFNFIEDLQNKSEELQIKAQSFLASIPDGDSLPTHEEIVNGGESWCDRILKIKDIKGSTNNITDAEKIKKVSIYFIENIEPYFCQEAVNYFKLELIAFIVLNSLPTIGLNANNEEISNDDNDSWCYRILRIEYFNEIRSRSYSKVWAGGIIYLRNYFEEFIKTYFNQEVAGFLEKQLFSWIEEVNQKIDREERLYSL